MARTDPKTRQSLGDATSFTFRGFRSLRPARRFGIASLTALILISMQVSAAPILQPGPPGKPSVELSPDVAALVSQAGFSVEDVQFLQDMIVHHQQAIDMAQMVSERTNQQAFLDVAGRIET